MVDVGGVMVGLMVCDVMVLGILRYLGVAFMVVMVGLVVVI